MQIQINKDKTKWGLYINSKSIVSQVANVTANSGTHMKEKVLAWIIFGFTEGTKRLTFASGG